MTAAKFSQDVEKIASYNEMNYIDAVSYTHLTLPTILLV